MTTFTSFYHRLVAISKKKNLSLAQTVRTLLEPALEAEETKARQKIYEAFEKVKGISLSSKF